MTKFYDDYLAMPDVLLFEAARDSGDELTIALGKRLEQEIEERAREAERWEQEAALDAGEDA